MKRRVWITGLGALTTFGVGAEPFWRALTSGQSGIGPLNTPADGIRIQPARVGAAYSDFDPNVYFTSNDLPLLDRFSQFAVLAAREAVADAGLAPESLAGAAAVVGTGCGGKDTDDEIYRRLYWEQKSQAHPLTIPRGMPCAPACQVSIQLGIRGPVFGVTSACASAAYAVAQAVLMIRGGMVDIAIAGGTDAPFSPVLLKAWDALRVLAPDTCRPFCKDRKGLVLGEGAGMVVLEAAPHARNRGVRPYAELAGIGLSADAGHITDPSPEGAARAISSALREAGMAPGEVDYINAHGTGTRANDVSETRAIRQVFGQEADRLLVSSTKSMHGHSLGAAAGMELVATALALRHGVVPPTANFTEPGEGCDLDYVPNVAREIGPRAALSNSFAFGGLNAVLALRRVTGA